MENPEITTASLSMDEVQEGGRPEASEGRTWCRLSWSGVALGVLALALSPLVIGALPALVGAFLATWGFLRGRRIKQYEREEAGGWASVQPSQRFQLGQGVAVCGIVLCYSALVASALAGAGHLIWPKVAAERAATMREDQLVRADLHAARLYQICEAFARGRNDQYPAQWQELLKERVISENRLLPLLHSAYESIPEPLTTETLTLAFELVKHERPVLDSIADSVVVMKEIAPATVATRAVVYADGSVKRKANPRYRPPAS